MESGDLVLLTGATGYVGGRLLRALEGGGRRVRCLARNPHFVRHNRSPGTEVVEGDVLDAESLGAAMRGVHTAYYLVHSMAWQGGFAERDRKAAENFAQAARAAGVRRIIYLGGLGNGSVTSPHLASRHEVGRILRESGVPAIELRASVIIGSGSLSFEMIRSLVDRLPVMVTPRWVRALSQPIAIEDVIAYLVAALEMAADGSAVYQIGGANRVSYQQVMLEYARRRGLRRLIIPVPVLTPRLSSLWLGLVTPLYARVGRRLIDSILHETVVTDQAAAEAFPQIQPMGMGEAIDRALRNEDRDMAETHWADALSSAGPTRSWGGVRFGSRLVDSQVARVPQPASATFAPIRSIGGGNGWYFWNWLWRLRGLLDLVVGGAGMRRGRRHPEDLNPGDAVDFWRVEEYQRDRLLRLFAEMKLPGRAWLQFEVAEDELGTIVRQTAIFDPVGLPGLLYWYGLYPVHALVFRGMLRGICREAQKHG